MRQKLLFWLSDSFLHFGIAQSINKKIECDLYAVADVNDETKKFYQKQKLVPFNKIWYYPDHIQNKEKKPDMDYVKSFEERFNINLRHIAYAERIFLPKYNKWYKFSNNEILLILEQACKFFENVLENVKPHFLITKVTIGHNDHLLYKMCKSKKISVLTLQNSRIGYRLVVYSDKDENLAWAKSNKNMKDSKTFEELRNYLERFSLYQQFSKDIELPKVSKLEKLKASFSFFLQKNKNYKNHYENYGKNRLNVLIKGSATSNHLRKKKLNHFINRNFIHRIDNNTPFIYFPLHFEPERNLLITNSFYSNQLQVLTNIVKSLPVDYQLYVKDHPKMKTLGWRKISYYKQIMELPNVKLLHPSISPVEILKNCSLVIAISGSAAMEAAFYEKPSIVFSDTEMLTFSSIYKLKNINELPNAIRTSLKKKVDPNELSSYLDFLIKNSFQGDMQKFEEEFGKQFPYLGYLKESLIAVKKMETFLEDNRKFLDILANEHIKKIKLHENLDLQYKT